MHAQIELVSLKRPLGNWQQGFVSQQKKGLFGWTLNEPID